MIAKLGNYLVIFIIGVTLGWILYDIEGVIALAGIVTFVLTTYKGRSTKVKIVIFGVLVLFFGLVFWWITQSFPPR